MPRPISQLPTGSLLDRSGLAASDVALAAVDAYWTYCRPWGSSIHRETFEAAFSNPSCPIYGGKPTALLFAVAALGVRFAELPGLTDFERQLHSREFSERAKELLLAGYYGSSRPPMPEGSGLPPLPDHGAITRLEAAQTIIFIFQFCVSSGLAPKGFVLLQRLFDVLLELCLDGNQEQLRGINWEPTNHTEWIYHEMRMRLWGSYVAMDVTFAYQAQREPLHDYFSHPFPLAAHEYYFDSLPAEIAFDYLFLQESPAQRKLWTTPADISRLLSTRDPNERNTILIHFIQPIVSHRRTVFGFTLLATCLRYFRIRIREAASRLGVDPYRLACKMGLSTGLEDLEPSERIYLDFVDNFLGVVGAFRSILPDQMAQVMSEGSTAALFEAAHFFFVDERYAHLFLLSCLSMLSACMENWIGDTIALTAELPAGSDSGVPTWFFASPAFTSVLEFAIIFTRILEGQLSNDPGLVNNHYALFMSTLRTGSLHLAAYKLSRSYDAESLDSASREAALNPVSESIVYDIKVVALHLEVMGARFRPWGEFVILANYKRSLILTNRSILQANNSGKSSKSSCSRRGSFLFRTDSP